MCFFQLQTRNAWIASKNLAKKFNPILGLFLQILRLKNSLTGNHIWGATLQALQRWIETYEILQMKNTNQMYKIRKLRQLSHCSGHKKCFKCLVAETVVVFSTNRLTSRNLRRCEDEKEKWRFSGINGSGGSANDCMCKKLKIHQVCESWKSPQQMRRGTLYCIVILFRKELKPESKASFISIIQGVLYTKIYTY